MRVAREFQIPSVARQLETVREDALEAFLQTAPRDPDAVALQGWQMHEIEAGLREADTEEGVTQEKVAKWVESWGTSNELPAPK